MADKPGKPPVKLKYLMWDGTDPVDSFALASGLERQFRSVNLLDSSPAAEEFCSTASKGKPRVYQPAGPMGGNIDNILWFRGMGEFPMTFFSPTHNNSAGDLPHILQFSGHGVPGFMFSNSDVLIACSRPITLSGGTWIFAPSPAWNNPNTKLVIFSACRQLAGQPQQFLWSQRMRGSNPVHCILSYRNTAPAASTSADINFKFLKNCAAGQTFINAWKNAHTGGDLPKRWAALCYKSAVGESLDKWVKGDSLATPDPAKEDILYFDNLHPSGVVVTQPKQTFDIFLSPRPGDAGPSTFPPWIFFNAGKKLTLHIKWFDAKDNFQNSDLVWLSALQVRPDYGGPFNIENLFEIEGDPGLPTFGYCHDASTGWDPLLYTDTYAFTINRASMSWLTHDASWNELQIPIKLLPRQNDHLPLHYFMIRVQRGSAEFGVPTDPPKGKLPRLANQVKLIEDFQFAVFILDPP